MTATPGASTRVAAAGGCCVVATLSYSGAVTLVALLAFVLTAVVLVTVVTAAVARLSLRLAAVAGLGAALGIAEIVNLVSGDAHGPAARSTFVAAIFTVLAVVAVLGPAPALFAAAVVGVVVGALGLGAGDEVAPVAVATAVVTVVALAIVEAQGRRWTRRPPQFMAVVVLTLLVGAFVAAIALQADRRIEGDPAVLAPGTVDPTIRPPQVLGDPSPQPTPTPPPAVEVDGAAPPSTSSTSSTDTLRTIWLVVSMILLTIILLVALRMIWIALSWRLLRRRLRRGSGPEQVAGAWVWSTRRLRAAGWPMPVSLSADVVASGQSIAGLPRPVRVALRQVAVYTVDAIYAPPAEVQEAEAAWTSADQVGQGAVGALNPSRRVRFALRSISSIPSHSAAPASRTLEERRS